jgi:predicted NBD/HSP70 family sugar kinase
VPDLARGTNQSGVRLYNERLVLSLIRRHGSLPKAEIARLTGLSAQTVSVIMRQLEADGLILRQGRLRGRIGQPSVPYAINPDGAYSIGFKIGRRSSDLILMDFAGGVRATLHETYQFPSPDQLVEFVSSGLVGIAAGVPASRISGIGIATPFELWNWEEEVGAPHEAMQAWRGVDIKAAVEAVSEWPVYVCNDATAACAAELVFGNGAHHLDFLYVFIGWFIGGGVVLNGSLFPGRSGYAGAVGPIPVPVPEAAPAGGNGRPRFQQLLRSASTYMLERRIKQAGGDPRPVWESPEDWSAIEPHVEGWIAAIAGDLALAVIAAVSVIDFQAVLIDGAFPPSVRARLVAAVRERAAEFDHQGIAPFVIAEGAVGSGARAIGGACLPLLANFARDRDVLFKETL